MDEGGQASLRLHCDEVEKKYEVHALNRSDMSRYSQYGYYDPVGSSQAQPTGYTYQTSSNPPSYPSAATTSGYGGNQQGYGSGEYGAQSYGNNAQNNSSTNHGAAALSSLGKQDYSQTSNRSSTGQYDHNQWYGSNASSDFGSSNLQPPNRSQANNSPLYTGTQASTFGRLSVPDQTQKPNSSAYGSSSTSQNGPSSAGTNYRHQSNNTQVPQNRPQRYNSPLHAVQAQQHSHQKQASRGSNHQPSPQMANAVRYAQQSRQQSASVEPSPTTVDPSQVYDNRAELERKARFEAERRKKIEAEQAAKKAEEDRLAAERRKLEEASEQAAEAVELAKKKSKAPEEKRQSKSAATTLQQMASMGAESSASGMGGDEEAEMRAMFQKMREFNSKNPAMLAKLWEEERKQHSEQSTSVQKPPPVPATKNTHSRQSAAQAQPKSAAPPNKVPPQQQPTIQQAKNLIGAQANPQATPSRPGAASSSTSLWPPHKKGALADATAKWLTGLPENAGKTISQQAVLNILNSNPSYVQLCESLEYLDMKFERSTLARELLKAVPDGLRMQAKPSTPTTNGVGTSVGAASTSSPQANRQTAPTSAAQPKSSGGPATVSYSTPLSLSEAAREVNQMHKSPGQIGGAVPPSQQSPYLSQSQTLTNGSRPSSQARAASQSQPPEVKPEVQPGLPPREPADKEEAARKRTFGDLVDLTKDDESDDDGPPSKKTFQMPSSGAMPSNASNGANTQHRDPFAYIAQQPGLQQPYKPYNYQPKNQVLGAGVMNPPQRPQAILPGDVSDAGAQAQPAQAPQVPPKPKDPGAESLQQSRMRGRMLVEPIMRDRVARKSRYDSTTIARDVLLATGRHPDMRGLNHHLSAMQKLLGHHGGEVDSTGTKCDLGTIRWDIIDPELPKESVGKQTVETKHTTRQSSTDSLAAPTSPIRPSVDYEAPFISTEVSAAPPKIKKKRGRPRASDSAAMLGERGSPSNATPAHAPTSSNDRDHTPVGPALLAHANDMAAAGTPVGYSAFRQVGPDGQVVKKKGRPVGWKKHIHSREAQGLPPHYPKKAGYAAGQLGRPPKEAKEKSLVEPQWQSFRCEWKGCKAELQNLDTLKRHLLKVHGREMEGGRGYECVWKGCDRQPGGGGGGFGGLEEWIGHVDQTHLQQIAWKQGDGPRGGSLGGE